MDKPVNGSTKPVEGIPIPDPLGIVEDFTDGKYYDPLRGRIRKILRQKVLGLAKSLEEE